MTFALNDTVIPELVVQVPQWALLGTLLDFNQNMPCDISIFMVLKEQARKNRKMILSPNMITPEHLPRIRRGLFRDICGFKSKDLHDFGSTII